MIKITEKFLKDKNACCSGFEYYKTLNTQDAETILNRCLDDNHFNWANWLIVRLMSHKQKIAYSVFASEQVIDIYEKKYPDNKAPRLAIEAAKTVLKRNTKKNRDAAAAAYADAYAAADAAYADAAYAYAYAAAYAYAYAAAAAAYAAADAAYADAAYAYADAAADAAYADADAAYADAARKEMQAKIINYGIKILNKKGKIKQ